MTETPENSEIVVSAEGPVAADPVASPVADDQPVHRVRGRRAAAVVGSLLLVCGLVGGVGYTVVAVRDADRGPGKPTWEFPAVSEDEGRKNQGATTGLSALLLPFGTDGHERGPDLGEFGADAELGGAQATALSKESVKRMPRSTRRELEKLIDKQGIQGVAMRSYQVGQSEDHMNAVTFEVVLQRMENRTAVRDIARSSITFLDSVRFFRKGPEIEDHKDARCFLTPKGGDQELGYGFCTAYVGDVLVRVTAVGPGRVVEDDVAKFFAAQLDRIEDPGQAV
ncbi:hypothetical protein ABT124_15310 [Streptomyces sp. NPDC001982]|uniref:hypothetical protein n=1 Tax=unclassified Streptomyces TaxID=2593676 RepID=UPI003332E08D